MDSKLTQQDQRAELYLVKGSSSPPWAHSEAALVLNQMKKFIESIPPQTGKLVFGYTRTTRSGLMRDCTDRPSPLSISGTGHLAGIRRNPGYESYLS